MGKRSAAGLLTSVDSIFTTQEERDNAQRSYVTDLSAAEISGHFLKHRKCRHTVPRRMGLITGFPEIGAEKLLDIRLIFCN